MHLMRKDRAGQTMTEKPEARLRPLQVKDVEAVASFERDIARISFPDDPITDLDFYMKKVRKLIDDRGAATFVAEAGGEVVGWAYVSKRQNFITKESYADFHSIFVSPSQRGTGTAGKLVEAVFDYCRNEKLDRVVFRTRATNEPMKAVLARVGFVPTQIFYERQITVDR
jgi:RimJ/RimL family protein N-acetyltransferase